MNMGATTLFVAGHTNFCAPDWLMERWKEWVSFGGAIASRHGLKYWREFEMDLQRALKESWRAGSEPYVTLIYLHECGNVTRADVGIDEIRYSEPDGWHEVPHVPPHEAWDPCVDRPWPPKERGVKSATDSQANAEL